MYAEPGDMYVRELRAAKSPCSERSPRPTPDPCALCPPAQGGLWFAPVFNGGHKQGDCRAVVCCRLLGIYA